LPLHGRELALPKVEADGADEIEAIERARRRTEDHHELVHRPGVARGSLDRRVAEQRRAVVVDRAPVDLALPTEEPARVLAREPAATDTEARAGLGDRGRG